MTDWYLISLKNYWWVPCSPASETMNSILCWQGWCTTLGPGTHPTSQTQRLGAELLSGLTSRLRFLTRVTLVVRENASKEMLAEDAGSWMQQKTGQIGLLTTLTRQAIKLQPLPQERLRFMVQVAGPMEETPMDAKADGAKKATVRFCRIFLDWLSAKSKSSFQKSTYKKPHIFSYRKIWNLLWCQQA